MCFSRRKRVARLALLAVVWWLGVFSARAAPGDEVWAFQTGDAIFGSPAQDSEGTFYVGSRDKHVYAVTKDGQLKWSFLAGDWVDSSPTLSPDESTVYFGSWDNKLYAVDAATGAKRWEYATGNLIIASPAVDAQGNVYVGSSDGFFYSLTSGGAMRWSYYVGEEMDSSPAAAEDGSVYVGAFDGSLYAFAQDGSLKWTFATDEPVDALNWRVKSPPTIGATGEVYFGGGNGILYAVSPAGVELWRFEATDKVDSGVVIDTQGRLVFGCRDGSVYCLDENGVLVWESYVGDVFYSTPSIDSLDRIAVGSYIGNGVSGVTVLEPDGSVAWEYLTLDYIDASPVFDEQGRVVFGCYDGALYAVESGSSQAKTSWSRFGGDRSNRSQQNALGGVIVWTEGYTIWTQSHGLYGSNADPSADTDGDSVPLAIEYLTGGDPETPDGNPLQSVMAEPLAGAPDWQLEFNRIKGETSIEVEIDLSSDLVTWQSYRLDAPELKVDVIDAGPFGDGKYERLRIHANADGRRFARLRISNQ